jgi:hypothetical protein
MAVNIAGQPTSIRLYQRGVPVANVRAKFTMIPVFADALLDPALQVANERNVSFLKKIKWYQVEIGLKHCRGPISHRLPCGTSVHFVLVTDRIVTV